MHAGIPMGNMLLLLAILLSGELPTVVLRIMKCGAINKHSSDTKRSIYSQLYHLFGLTNSATCYLT